MGFTFDSIVPEDLHIDIFNAIRWNWLLITGGTIDSYNSMTACWGGLGHLWDIHPTCFIFVRPQRHTYEYLEQSEYFTVQTFSDKYKDQLLFLGRNSGRDIDKIEEVGFTPIETSKGSVYYGESQMVLCCKKVFFLDFDPKNFLDNTVIDWYRDNYPEHGYHRMFFGAIENILINKTI